MNILTLLAQSTRSLLRSVTFSVTTALTLAIGIGATTAVFSVLDAVVLRPLPYPEPSRLYGAWFAFPGMHVGRGPQSLATYAVYKQYAHTIQGMALVDRASVNMRDPNESGPPLRLHAAKVTANMFPLLGATFVRGRGFLDTEDVPNAPEVAIISSGLWRSRFGSDPSILGRKIEVDGTLREIVGVASSGFHFPDSQTELWIPAAWDLHAAFSGGFFHNAFVRLRPGIAPAAAEKELNDLLPRAGELFAAIAPGLPLATVLKQSGAHALLSPLRDDVVGPVGGALWIAAAAAICLLAIAAANVANLMLTRAERRRRELAVRVALGAGRFHLAMQFVGELAVLSSVGGIFGVMLGSAAVSYFRRLAPPTVPRVAEIEFDTRIVFLALVASVGVGLLCSVLPVIRFHTRSLLGALSDGSRGGTSGRDRQRVRRLLVVTQVAFAVVLVTGSTLLLRSASRLRDVKPGFDADSVLTMWLSLPQATYPRDSDMVRFAGRLLDRVAVLQGVHKAAVTSKLPLENTGRGYGPVYADNDQTPAGNAPPIEQLDVISGAYFETMGIPLLAGHAFDRLERQQAHEVVVDKKLATQYWGDSTGKAALGRRLRFGQGNVPWYTVVGVVGTVFDTSLAAPRNGVLYVPDVADPDSSNSLVARVFALTVRTGVDQHGLVAAIQKEIDSMDPALPAFDVESMGEVVNQSMDRLTFIMVVLTVVAVVALCLASIGLYGVIAYLVSLRTKELGVRIALGAQPSAVSKMVTREGVMLTGVGVVVGFLGFLALVGLLRARLNGVASTDLPTLAAVGTVLMLVAVCASWIPARRAASVDPTTALSAD